MSTSSYATPLQLDLQVPADFYDRLGDEGREQYLMIKCPLNILASSAFRRV